MVNIFKAKGTSIDAIWLTIVRFVTMAMGLACIKIVSVYFSLEEYAIYAQATLVVTTVCSFSILGLTDAVNYFYNRQLSESYSKGHYLATIFGIQTIVGLAAGIFIILGASYLVDYFDSPELYAAIGWIAFQPLLQNYIPMLQVLYISAGRAKSIAFINLLISGSRLAIFMTASFVTNSIITILALTLILDIAQVLYFVIDLHRHQIVIEVKKFCRQLCMPILSYAIPMAAFVIINSLLRDTDKWVIGYMASPDELAIYTNCSRVLPFDILTTSLFTVLVPIITKYITNRKDIVRNIFSNYLNIGLITTSILVGCAIWLSKDLLLCLFDEKYLPGLNVFIIYLLVDFARFANVTLLYSSSGRVKDLLLIVGLTFAINLVAAIVLYKMFGLVGPALATLLSIIFSYACYIAGGSKIIEYPIVKLFDYRSFALVLIEICVIGASALWIGSNCLGELRPEFRFLILYPVAIAIVGLINRKPILRLVKQINSAR